MCGSPVLPRDVIVVANLVCVVSVEGLLADVASRLVVEFVGEASIPLQHLLVVVERDRILLEVPHLIHITI